MHLLSIKIAGFKSFADPVTIHVPKTLSGVVGPNGSGKSNIIDAMRWVIGESSAKSLRGGTLDDVIFNGSAQRKPASQASVELLFDNSLSRCGGQWAKYAEISVRRTIARDGLSEYSINGTRCRRRDVKELFTGTGFGARSYSIIEQGMVSRIVEGKPEDLSAFIEEASGVSRFREKRHETHLKMNRVEQNLERLEDMRHEIDKRLRQLKYQAEQARRYTRQKAKLHDLRVQLLAFEWGELNRQVEAKRASKSDLELGLEQRTVRLRALEADLEQVRQDRLGLETKLTDAQMEQFRIDAEIADHDRRIKESTEQWEATKAQVETRQTQVRETEQLISDQKEKARFAGLEFDRVGQLLAESTQVLRVKQTQLKKGEESQVALQQKVDHLDQLVIDAVRRQESASTALEQNNRSFEIAVKDLEDVKGEITRLLTDVEYEESRSANQEIVEANRICDQLRSEIDGLEFTLTDQRTLADKLAIELDALRESAQETHVHLGTLERVISAAATEVDEEFSNWLVENDLQSAHELYRNVAVSDGWERAVDRVLGEKLSALCVDDIEPIARKINEQKFPSRRYFVSGGSANGSKSHPRSLSRLVKSSNHTAEAMLAGVYTADSLDVALGMRNELGGNECVVTEHGALVGANWFSPALSDEESTGILETANHARELREKVAEFNALKEETTRQINETRESVAGIETRLGEKRKLLAEKTEHLEQLRTKVSEDESRRLRCAARLNEMQLQAQQLSEKISALETEQTETRKALEAENEALTSIEQQRLGQLTRSRAQTAELRDLQEQVSDEVRNCHRFELETQKIDAERQIAVSSLADLEQRLSEFQSEIEMLKAKLASSGDPTGSLKQALAEFVRQKQTAETRLVAVRNEIEESEIQRRQMDEERLQRQLAVDEVNLKLQEQNVELGRLCGQSDEIGLKISELDANAEEVLASLDEQFDYEDAVSKFERLERRIDSTGSVNLVAVEQFEQESERKEYMDRQYDDLTRAMETLKQTIKKIDKESRERFIETFSIVNSEYQRLLPKLFGGGSGHLELIGEYPENSGMRIYARPKGKRILNIQALSGGEKALTAIALILSFFQLNPSPVCLLDEVDAPLDDDNIYRLCESLQSLSNTTQLIVITHNKITMEFVDTLIGITMPEPNVSKILSVDLMEAQEFAA